MTLQTIMKLREKGRPKEKMFPLHIEEDKREEECLSESDDDEYQAEYVDSDADTDCGEEDDDHEIDNDDKVMEVSLGWYPIKKKAEAFCMKSISLHYSSVAINNLN